MDQKSLRPLSLRPPPATFPLTQKTALTSTSFSSSPTHPIPSIYKLTFSYPPSHSLPFNPLTQSIQIIPSIPFSRPHHYVILTPCPPGEFSIVVKADSSDATSTWLTELPLGTYVRMLGPIPPSPKQVDISPGSKLIIISFDMHITRAYPATRHLLNQFRKLQVTLVHSVRFREEGLFVHELGEMEEVYEGRMECLRVASGERVEGWWGYGNIDRGMLKRLLEGARTNSLRFWVVGSVEITESTWGALNALGYDRDSHDLVVKVNPEDPNGEEIHYVPWSLQFGNFNGPHWGHLNIKALIMMKCGDRRPRGRDVLVAQ